MSTEVKKRNPREYTYDIYDMKGNLILVQSAYSISEITNIFKEQGWKSIYSVNITKEVNIRPSQRAGLITGRVKVNNVTKDVQVTYVKTLAIEHTTPDEHRNDFTYID